MWFEDLSPCTYFSRNWPLVAVGWLERGKPYAAGETPREVYERLAGWCEHPWEPVMAKGHHECDLCQFKGATDASNLFIPGNDGRIFAAPAMIGHYINVHRYQPPAVFCAAVMACSEMRSMAYLRAVKGLR